MTAPRGRGAPRTAPPLPLRQRVPLKVGQVQFAEGDHVHGLGAEAGHAPIPVQRDRGHQIPLSVEKRSYAVPRPAGT